MNNGGFFGMHWFWWLLILVVILLFFFIGMQNPFKTPATSPKQLLKKRLAKGEITKEEYDQLINRLND